jgi:hypothetical protein
MIIIGIVAVIILAGLFALFKLTPHKGAGVTPKPRPSQSGQLHPGETRSSGLD